MRVFCLALAMALLSIATSAQAQTPVERKDERVIAGAVFLATFAAIPPLVGIAIGLARPGSEFNIPFGIALAGVSIVGIATSAWSIADALRPRVMPTLVPTAHGMAIGVAGVF